MVLKDFRLDVPGRGRVNVEFRLHFDQVPASVGEIKIHTDFEAPLPHRVQLKLDGNRWKLFAEHPVRANGEVAVVPEFLDDDVSLAIADRIVSIRDRES